MPGSGKRALIEINHEIFSMVIISLHLFKKDNY